MPEVDMSAFKNMNQISIRFAPLLVLLSFFLNSFPPALAQTEYWETENRSRSQNLCSSALNHLLSENAEKKRSYWWSRKKEDELRQAVVLLDRAIVADPTDPLPHYLLGIALSMQGNHEKALPVLQKANKLDPNEHETLLAAGLAQHLAGNYERAFSILTKLSKRFKSKGRVYVVLGHAQFRAGALEDALDSFTKAANDEPHLQSAHEGLALVYYIAGDLSKARSSAVHAQSILDYPPVELLLAEVDNLQGDQVAADKVLKDWRKEMRRMKPHKSMADIGFTKQHDSLWDPFIEDRYDTYYSILAREALRGDAKKAARYGKSKALTPKLQEVESKIAAKSDDFYLLHEKGLLNLALQNFKEAVESFKKSMDICPDNKVDLLNLAIAYDQLGESQKAASCLKQYRSIYPEAKLNNYFNKFNSMKQQIDSGTTSKTRKRGKQADTDRVTKPKEEFPF